MCFSFRLLLKLLEKRKFLIHKSASGKPVSVYITLILIFLQHFFAFVVNLIKRKLETVSISSSEIVAVCRSTLLTKKKLEFLQHKSLMESEIYANFSDFQVDSEDSNQ
jgi:hypothetical protein